MNRQQHTIKKFSLELQIPGREQAYALQRKCIKMINESLVAEMDKILSNNFPADETIRINRIEIDLGDLTMEELENNFVDKYISGFAGRIKKISKKQIQPGDSEEIIIVKEEDTIQQLIYFLSSGKMHWASQGINFQQWQARVIAAIKINPAFFKQQFTASIKLPTIAERLVTQFEDDFIGLLVEPYHPGLSRSFSELFVLMKNIFSAASNMPLRKYILLKLLPVLFEPGRLISEEERVDITARINASITNVEISGTTQFKTAFISLLEKLTIPDQPKLIQESGDNKITEYVSVDKTKEEITKAKLNNEKDDKAIYINNAGIILLHPFLQKFFTAAELLQEDNFMDDLSVHSAVHLLQYMASGELELPEYVMPLNKILCGMNAEEHIDRFINPGAAQLKEATELLEAMIQHWTALKNTSVQGLQQTFFQRQGKLSFIESDGFWKLQVERKAVDILLDKIPWGISYIKLPWMTYALVTEW